MKFIKMQALGNDFIIINGFIETISSPEKLAVFILDRKKGAGADGLIILLKSDNADAKMRVFNPDGSEAEACGNGVRCAVLYLSKELGANKKNYLIETPGGTVRAKLFSDKRGVVKIEAIIPVATTEPKKAGLNSSIEILGKEKIIAGEKVKLSCVGTGNPHAVIEGYDLNGDKCEKIYNFINECGLFEKGANVEFIRYENGVLNMRVFERGAGETLACGTGACAAVYSLYKRGIIKENKSVAVNMKGGSLKVSIVKGLPKLTGSAEFCYKGEIYVSDRRNR